MRRICGNWKTGVRLVRQHSVKLPISRRFRRAKGCEQRGSVNSVDALGAYIVALVDGQKLFNYFLGIVRIFQQVELFDHQFDSRVGFVFTLKADT